MKTQVLCLVLSLALCASRAFAASHTVTFRRLNGTVLLQTNAVHGANATAMAPALPAETDFTAQGWDCIDKLACVTNDVTCWALYEASTSKSPSTSIASQSVANRETPYSLEEYFQIYDNLAWSDEFSGSSLSVGNGNDTNWKNDTEKGGTELQTYTSGSNHSVSDGTLKLTCKRESSTRITSARINTKGKVAFLKGRCEIRAKITKANGAFPAFWTMGSNRGWPWGGEIDVFEQLNGSDWITGSLHMPRNPNSYTDRSYESGGESLAVPEDGVHWGDGFHRIGIIVNERDLVWYVDDHIFQRMDIRDTKYDILRNDPQYILLNYAFGGSWSGVTNMEQAENFTSEDFVVDYCRIFTNTNANNTVERTEPAGAQLSGPVKATVWRGWQMRWGKSGAGYYQNHLIGRENLHIRTAMREYLGRDNTDIVTFLTRTTANSGGDNLESPVDVPGYTALYVSPNSGRGSTDWDGDIREKLLGTVLFNSERFSKSDSAVGTLQLSNDYSFTNGCAVVAELVEKDTGAKVKVVSVFVSNISGATTSGSVAKQGFDALISKLDAMKDEKVILLVQGWNNGCLEYLNNRVSSELSPSYSSLGQYIKSSYVYQSAWATANYEASAANPAPLSVPKANGQASGVHTNQAYCATVDFNFPPPKSGFSFGPATASAGYAWTNGVATVTASVTNAAAMPEGAKVRLTVTDAAGNVLGTMEREWTGAGDYAFDTAGAIGGDAFADGFDYVCTFTLVDADGAAIDDDEGGVATATLRLGAEDPWFSADAAAGTVAGGDWAEAPAVAGGAYAIESENSFQATESRDGFARIEVLLNEESTVFESDLPELLAFAEASGQRASLVAVQRSGGGIVWMGLVQDNGSPAWKWLGEVDASSGSVQAIFELDTTDAEPRVSYLAGEAGGGLATRLHDAAGATWFNAPGGDSPLAGHIDFRGTGRVAAFSGRVLDKAVAEADGVRYGSLAEALATGDVTLLTNAEWPADAPAGTFSVDPDGHTLLRGGVSVAGGSVVVDSGPVVLAGEGTVRVTFANLARLGVATAGLSPAELAAALAEDGANGIPKWQSYVLGLDTTDPDALPRADIAVADDIVAVSDLGIEVDENAGATVTYQVYEIADLAHPDVDTAVGTPAVPGTPVELQAGNASSRFFRIKVKIDLP